VAVLVVVLAGCGASPKVSTNSTTSNQQRQQKAQAAFTAMNSCLTKVGYHFVGPPSDETPANMHVETNNAADQQTVKDPAYKQAWDKCAASTGFNQLVNNAGNRQPSAQDIQKANKQTLQMYTCMRQKGWTLADPTKDSRGMLSPPTPPSSVQGDQARMGQFGNDLNSCFKKSGANGSVRTSSGQGSGGNGAPVSVSGGS
jgi:hypothetical protein